VSRPVNHKGALRFSPVCACGATSILSFMVTEDGTALWRRECRECGFRDVITRARLGAASLPATPDQANPSGAVLPRAVAPVPSGA
jgi:hypothetical protein